MPFSALYAAGALKIFNVSRSKASVNMLLSLILILNFYWTFFIYISNVIPFPGFPEISPLSNTPHFFSKGVPLPNQHPFGPPLPTFPYPGGGFQTCRIKGFSIHWSQTKPSSATYADKAKGPCIVFG